MQITNTILMIRPLHFCMNEETAVNNYFQQQADGLDDQSALQMAQREFDEFVSALREKGVEVIVVEDRLEVRTPDSIFPNNWISFHANGDVALYPMFAENRRLERREDILELLEEKGFQIDRVIDLSGAEQDKVFLEGTGSLLLDRENSVAYCALSERSDEELFFEFCEIFGYKPITFSAFQSVNGERKPIYHTNVLLTIGESFAVLCADCIDNGKERQRVMKSLQRNEKEVILISEDQLARFAGNMLQVIGSKEERYLVMSKTAHDSLTSEQIETLKKHTKLLVVEIPTIERLGGGSARCMMAEVFLPNESATI
jgi:hypothetical protein